ncbi:hypothetical protein MMC12_005606 [Toensbergia leucococca]|nr:hypothetical protein [Toensbergia leucococca]
MAEAFGIFGAVSGALGTLNLARVLFTSLITTVREYREAGAKLIDLSHSFDSFLARLDIWAKCWHVSDESPFELYIALWSYTGCSSIFRQLAFIDKTSEDFARILSKLVNPDKLARLDPKLKLTAARVNRNVVDYREMELHTWRDARNGHRAGRKEKSKALGKLAQNALSPRDKANFILLKSEQLSEYLDDLNERFNVLYNDALDSFTAMHPSAERTASVTARREIAAASMLLQRALGTKAASEALYQTCLNLSCQEKQKGHAAISAILRRNKKDDDLPKLEMNLLLSSKDGKLVNHDDHNTPKLFYHLLIAWPKAKKRQEILVEGPVQPRIQHPYEPHVATDFEKACMMVQGQRSCDFQAPSDLEAELWFRLTSPSDLIQAGSQKEVHLSGLLDRIQTKTSAEAHEQFPLSERLDLAYKIVECGLLLLGTSWFSNLSSKRIQRISRPGIGQRRRFLLETGNSESEELTSVEPQTFSIGVLLTEIAIAQSVIRITKFKGDDGIELDLVMAILRGRTQECRPLPAAEVITRVDQNMGQRYSRAVETVFNSRRERGTPIGPGLDSLAIHQIVKMHTEKCYKITTLKCIRRKCIVRGFQMKQILTVTPD